MLSTRIATNFISPVMPFAPRQSFPAPKAGASRRHCHRNVREGMKCCLLADLKDFNVRIEKASTHHPPGIFKPHGPPTQRQRARATRGSDSPHASKILKEWRMPRSAFRRHKTPNRVRPTAYSSYEPTNGERRCTRERTPVSRIRDT